MVESEDPTVMRSIAVRAEDLVTALEATRRSGRQTVLRITPPFSGRMRARIHEASIDSDEAATHSGEESGASTDSHSGNSSADGPEPIHVDPTSLVDSGIPSYPDPADTEDLLRSDPDREYSRERHREVHTESVEEWRDAVPAHAVGTVQLDTFAGNHEVDVTILG